MKSDPQSPNPYESPRAASAGSPGGFRISFPFVTALLASGLLVLLVLLSRSSALLVFSDFDVQLPIVTRFFLSPAFLLLTCGLFLFTLVKEFVLPPVMSTRGLNWLSALAAILLGAAYAFVVVMAWASLVQALA